MITMVVGSTLARADDIGGPPVISGQGSTWHSGDKPKAVSGQTEPSGEVAATSSTTTLGC